jgi:hypothetical protein
VAAYGALVALYWSRLGRGVRLRAALQGAALGAAVLGVAAAPALAARQVPPDAARSQKVVAATKRAAGMAAINVPAGNKTLGLYVDPAPVQEDRGPRPAPAAPDGPVPRPCPPHVEPGGVAGAHACVTAGAAAALCARQGKRLPALVESQLIAHLSAFAVGAEEPSPPRVGDHRGWQGPCALGEWTVGAGPRVAVCRVVAAPAGCVELEPAAAPELAAVRCVLQVTEASLADPVPPRR